LGRCNGPFAVSAGNEDRPEADWGLSSLTSEIRFPVRGEGPARDSVRMRQRQVCMQEIRDGCGESFLQTLEHRGGLDGFGWGNGFAPSRGRFVFRVKAVLR